MRVMKAKIISSHRVFRELISLTFNFSDFAFKEKFRVSKRTAEYILNLFGHVISFDNNCSFMYLIQS